MDHLIEKEVMEEFRWIKWLGVAMMAAGYGIYSKKVKLYEAAEALPYDEGIKFRKDNMYKYWVPMKKFLYITLVLLIFIIFSKLFLPILLDSIELKKFNYYARQISIFLFILSLLVYFYHFYLYRSIRNELDYENIDIKELLEDFKKKKK